MCRVSASSRCMSVSFQNVAKPPLPLSRSGCRERAGGLERPPGPHCAAEETSQGFDDVGMKWQKLLVSRKHKDQVTQRLHMYSAMIPACQCEGNGSVSGGKGGLKSCFSPKKKPKRKRPGCVSSGRQRTATAGRLCWINRRGVSSTYGFYSSYEACLTGYCPPLWGDGDRLMWVTRATVKRCYYNIHGDHQQQAGQVWPNW